MAKKLSTIFANAFLLKWITSMNISLHYVSKGLSKGQLVTLANDNADRWRLHVSPSVSESRLLYAMKGNTFIYQFYIYTGNPIRIEIPCDI